MAVFADSMDHISRGKKKQKSKDKTVLVFLATHLALFTGTWQKSPNAVRLDTRV